MCTVIEPYITRIVRASGSSLGLGVISIQNNITDLLSTNFAGGHLTEPVLRGGYMSSEGVLLS